MTRPLHKHPALKVALVVSALVIADSLIDLLPYHGYCSFGYYDAFVELGFLVWALALLGFIGWAGADIWTWFVRAPERDHWAGAPVAAFVLIVIGMGCSKLGAHLETAAVERFTQQMQPTVSAIQGYIARHGSPPESLTSVTTPPDPGICSEKLTYESEGPEWTLEFTLVESAFRGEWIRYRPNRRYKDRERVINGWGWRRWVD